MGRRNYLSIGYHEAAQNAAIIYSLLGSCVQQGVSPQDWLTDVLKRLPTQAKHQIHELLPHRWKITRPNEPPWDDGTLCPLQRQTGQNSVCIFRSKSAG